MSLRVLAAGLLHRFIMKCTLVSVVRCAFVLVLTWATAVWADDAQDLDKLSKGIDTELKGDRSHEAYYARLSQEVDVEVAVLKADRAKYRMGYGDFYLAELIAHKSGQPIEVIVGDWRAKRGWGAIAKAHDIKLGPVVSAARKSHQAWSKGESGKSDRAEKANTKAANPSRSPGKADSASSNSGGNGGPGGKGGGKKK